ncbi:hypothetical protein [Archangium sp.]|uniref:hypothetical protein n=1 Tax=Archangium sp. TaxID=1872627 RepID=UPI002D24FB7D|nr:hypothetical protein [Archangium sp.]HYO55589.1 hypothetical protein [Archangium sp.]
MAFDLRLALRQGYTPHLFVREWLDLPAWAELRCFMRGRQLVGVTQYNYRGLGGSPELHEHASRLRAAVKAFFAPFCEACHLDDVVFDVFAVSRYPRLPRFRPSACWNSTHSSREPTPGSSPGHTAVTSTAPFASFHPERR